MKTKIKKILTIIYATIAFVGICAGFLFLLIGMSSGGRAYAAEDLEDVAITAEEILEESPTFGSRVEAWFSDNLTEILSGLGTGFSAIFITVICPYIRKRLSSVSRIVANNEASNEEVIFAVNNLINKYNQIEAYLTDLDGREKQRESAQKQVATIGKATLEILATVYANSKLPQATKDLVSMKYVAALKEGIASNEVVADAQEIKETEND